MLLKHDEKFIAVEIEHLRSVLELILERGDDFGIVARTAHVSFNPALPKELSDDFAKRPVIFFDLGNYTLQSAHIVKDEIKFEAGFGEDDFACEVGVPFYSIMELEIDEKPVLVNFGEVDEEWLKREKSRKIFAK